MAGHLFGIAAYFAEVYCLEYDHLNGEWPLEYAPTGYDNFRDKRSFFATPGKFWIDPAFDFAGADQAGSNALGIDICWFTLYPFRICEQPYCHPTGFGSLYPLFRIFRVSHDCVSIAIFWVSFSEHLLCESISIVHL